MVFLPLSCAQEHPPEEILKSILLWQVARPTGHCANTLGMCVLLVNTLIKRQPGCQAAVSSYLTPRFLRPNPSQGYVQPKQIRVKNNRDQGDSQTRLNQSFRLMIHQSDGFEKACLKH